MSMLIRIRRNHIMLPILMRTYPVEIKAFV